MKKKEGENLSEETIRLRELIEGTNMSLREYAKFIGISTTVLHNTISGRNNISYSILKALLTHIPKLNPRWLIFGEGEKFIKQNTSNEHLIELLEMKVSYLEQQIKDKEEIIMTLKETLVKKES